MVRIHSCTDILIFCCNLGIRQDNHHCPPSHQVALFSCRCRQNTKHIAFNEILDTVKNSQKATTVRYNFWGTQKSIYR